MLACGEWSEPVTANANWLCRKEGIVVDENIYVGKKLMLQCEVVTEYGGGCVIDVELPDGEKRTFHLNHFVTPDVKPYISWDQ